MKILVDNGHGAETRGKRSPDGRLREAEWTRSLAARVVAALRARGVAAELLTPERADVPIAERVRRANALHAAEQGGVAVVSLHCDAAGDGGAWHSARGWSVFVARGASVRSRALASALAAEAEARGLKVRRQIAGRPYWEAGFSICRHTRCPAVLVENLFQDNRHDVEFMLSDVGCRTLAEVVVEGVCRWHIKMS